MCVEVLRAVQDPSKSFEGHALCAGVRGLTRGGLPESAFRVEGDLVRDDLALGVEKYRCAVRPLPEAKTQLVDAVQKSVRGLPAGPGILAGEEVDVVTVRGRKRQLVLVRRSDGPEFAGVSGEKIYRPRLEAVRVGASVTSTGQGGASNAFVLSVLTATVNRPESGGGARRRCEKSNHYSGYYEPGSPYVHLRASLPTEELIHVLSSR